MDAQQLAQLLGNKFSTKDGMGNQPVAFGDGYNIDAFGRLRVSEPYTLFDSKNIFNDSDLASDVENLPLFYDNQETSGTGTSTAYVDNQSAQELSVSATTAGTRVRQTKSRFNYQPWKSFLTLLTFTFASQASGITMREWLFDDENWLFLEDNGSEYRFVTRTYTSGSAVDNAVSQSDWNIDPMNWKGKSWITLDFTKTQIMFFDYEWLGVGRVRMWFVVDGKIYYAHEFLNTNNLSIVYMTTPNLPLRSEISNDGTWPASTMTQICSSVIIEWWQNNNWIIRYASTEWTHVDMATENTEYAVLGIRLKSNYIGTTVNILNIALQLHTASHKCEWTLKLNPTVAWTFTYWDLSRSAIQYAKWATANTVTWWYNIGGWFIESWGNPNGWAGSVASSIDNALRLGSLIDGTRDTIVLCARPIAGSTAVDIEWSMTRRELL